MKTIQIFSLLFIFSTSILHLQAQTCSSVITSEVEIDGEASQFYWMDELSQRGLLLTSESAVYLTDSYGKAWVRVIFASDEDNSHPVRQIVQSSDLATVYVVSDDRFWLTEDAAQTWSTQELPYGDDWLFYAHPSKPHFILGVSWNSWFPCEFSLQRTTCYRELSVSYDSGKKWASVDKYVDEWQWTNGEEILFTAWDTAAGNQFYKNSEELVLYATQYINDVFSTRMIMDSGALSFVFLYQTESLFIAKRVSQQTTLNLYSSIDHGRTLNIVYFGTQPVQQNRYTVFESPEGDSVFIILESPDSDDWGTLYRGDEALQYFTLILPYIIKRGAHDPDIVEFGGLPGIYIVNHYNMSSSETTIQSAISYTSGSSWNYVSPPSEYQSGPNKCVPPCALHIDMDSDALPQSLSSAPGLMLALGNVGNSLQIGDTEGLFFTREAGAEWEQVLSERWDLYEMGDFGNLLIAAQTGKKDLTFSWDQGISWVECTVTNTDLEIQNFWSIPNNPMLFLMSLGSPSDDRTPDHELVFLNFSELHERECEGFDVPDTEESDYETWVPHVTTNECINGQKETYIRRKREAECYVPSGDEITTIQSCQCTFQDYECDYCYLRNPETKLCMFYCEQAEDLEAFCGDGQEYYYKSQGYRKISGNVCTGTTEYDPVRTPCPDVITTGSTGTSGSSTTTGSSSTGTSVAPTTSYIPDTTSNQESDDDDDDEDALPVIVLGVIVGVATLIGVALLVAWLIQAKNKPVPEELRDVGETNRLYDRT